MKKLLAILLTLCLMIPMAAFAEEVEVCTDGNHVGNLDVWTYISDPSSYEDAGDEGHLAYGALIQETYCDACGQTEYKVLEEESSQLDSHIYNEDGICYECGHQNTCDHPDVWTYEFVTDGTYTSVDNFGHEAKGSGVRRTACAVCDQTLEWEPVDDLTVYEQHSYDADGVCVVCGHVNDCTHDTVFSYNYLTEDWTELRYAPSDDNNHRVTGEGVIVTYCPDCGTDVKVEAKGTVDYWPHEFDGTVCTLCGYDRAAAKAEAAEEEKTEEAAAEEKTVDLGAFADILGAFGKELCGQDVEPDCKAEGDNLAVTYKLKEQAGEDIVKQIADKLTETFGKNETLLKVKDVIEKIAGGFDLEKLGLGLKFANADDAEIFNKTITYAEVKDLKAE